MNASKTSNAVTIPLLQNAACWGSFIRGNKARIFPAAAYILAKKYGWAISITPDDRGAGWSLYRFHEDSGIDFTRIKDHPDVTFNHFSGFLAKVREGSDFVELIDESVM